MNKILASRQLEPAEAEDLITNRVLGPLQGFRSKMGRPFASMLKMGDDLKLQFDFGQVSNGENAQEVDFTGQESLGKCPKCGSNVFENGMSYVCDKSVGKER